MLRYYDEKELLKPAEIDAFTGYRYYREDQLPVIGCIVALRDMEFSLAAIGEMLKNGDDPERTLAFLRVRRAELEALSVDTQQKLRLLDTAMEWLGKDKTMKYDVVIRTLPERYAAYTDSYGFCGRIEARCPSSDCLPPCSFLRA